MIKLFRHYFVYLIALVIVSGFATASFIHANSNGGNVAPQVKFGKPTSAAGVKANWNGNVTVTISLRDENGNEYSTQLVISNGMTSGSFTLEGIPAGVNYILTAVAEDSIGQKASLKAILSQIAANSTVNVIVDGLTTKIVDALELIAVRQGTSVHKLPATTVQAVQDSFKTNPNASPEEVADHFAYSVSGKVIDAGNNGIAGVTLGFSNGTTVTTGTDGSWSKSGLSGTVTVTPSKSGYSFTPVSTQVTGTANNVNFTGTAAPTTYAVSGKVIDANNNVITGVTLGFSDGSSVTTGTDGSWSKSGLSGTVTVTPSKSGYSFTPVSTQVTGTANNVNFTGTATFTASGRVTDGNGNGIEGVTISFLHIAASFDSVTTDANGYWVRDGLIPTVTVKPTKSGWHFDPESKSLKGSSSAVNFQGDPFYSVSGKVTDKKGKGIQGVWVNFSYISGSAKTDAQGNWSKANLYGTVKVTPEGEGTFLPASINVTQARSDVNFTIVPADYTVSGVVTDENGNGLKEVSIVFSGGYSGFVHTDASGKWSQTGLNGTVTITPQGHALSFTPAKIDVISPDNNINFVGKSVYYNISGRLTDENGNGVKGTIYLNDQAYGYTTEDGYYTINSLLGSNKIRPSILGRKCEPSEIVVNSANEHVDFKCTKVTYTFSGRIVDNAGNGIEGATISFYGLGTYGDVVTDANGYWTRAGILYQDSVRVYPLKSSWVFSPAELRISSVEGNQTINFIGVPFSQTYGISGRITDYSNNGVSGVEVNFTGGAWSVKTDSDGYWSRDGLLGKVTVIPKLLGWSFNPTAVEVSGASSSVNFQGVATNP